jgi:hypothetical protein
MSHVTTVTTQIKDIAAVRNACLELGLEVLETQRRSASQPTARHPAN